MLWNGKVPPKAIPVSQIPEEEIHWFWWPYIPAGSVTMLLGPGGSGKSHIAVDIASRVSTGEPFPGEFTADPPNKVLMLSAEDEVGRVLRPRLRKAGAKLENIIVPPMFFTLDTKGLELVEYYVTEVAAGIVFIDPVVAYIGGKVDLNKANEVRVFAGGLQKIAEKTKIPIITVHHTRKGTEGQDYEKALGSVDFINASRSALYTTIAPNGDRIMRHVKANYGPLGPTWGYRFGDKGFEWTGSYTEDGTKTATRAVRRNEAAEWIKRFLATGPIMASIIEQEAEKLGFNHRTLIRAKTGIAMSFLVHQNGKAHWYWKLKGDENASEVLALGAKREIEKLGRVDSEAVNGAADRIPEYDDTVDGDRYVRGQTNQQGNSEKPPRTSQLRVNDDIEDLMDKVLG